MKIARWHRGCASVILDFNTKEISHEEVIWFFRPITTFNFFTKIVSQMNFISKLVSLLEVTVEDA